MFFHVLPRGQAEQAGSGMTCGPYSLAPCATLFVVNKRQGDLTHCEFASRFTGYRLDDVWSGLKHLGTHEFVGQSLVDAVD